MSSFLAATLNPPRPICCVKLLAEQRPIGAPAAPQRPRFQAIAEGGRLPLRTHCRAHDQHLHSVRLRGNSGHHFRHQRTCLTDSISVSMIGMACTWRPMRQEARRGEPLLQRLKLTTRSSGRLPERCGRSARRGLIAQVISRAARSCSVSCESLDRACLHLRRPRNGALLVSQVCQPRGHQSLSVPCCQTLVFSPSKSMRR
mmetsp:Transcript_42285/g.79161  ORF Transcript_42285/g.79161 Transcript_42285/m.79161 type:complete len:201 (-) Transcript_42285:181-783(-)